MTAEQHRNQFLTFVYLGAIVHDMGHGTRDAPFIATFAGRIPAGQIPDDCMAAAQDLIRSFEGKKPKRWMIPPVHKS